MNKNIFLVTTGIFFTLMLSTCQSKITSSIDNTVLAPLPADVTPTVEQPILPDGTEGTSALLDAARPTLSVTIHTDYSSVELDHSYFDGIMVLTRYYTLLDQGLFEEVIPLYSESLYEKSGGKNFEADLRSVELISIRPYNYWLAQQGRPPEAIPKNELRYIVDTIVLHNAPAWNDRGTPVPDGQTRFVSLILENSEWKLNELNSSPWFH